MKLIKSYIFYLSWHMDSTSLFITYRVILLLICHDILSHIHFSLSWLIKSYHFLVVMTYQVIPLFICHDISSSMCFWTPKRMLSWGTQWIIFVSTFVCPTTLSSPPEALEPLFCRPLRGSSQLHLRPSKQLLYATPALPAPSEALPVFVETLLIQSVLVTDWLTDWLTEYHFRPSLLLRIVCTDGNSPPCFAEYRSL